MTSAFLISESETYSLFYFKNFWSPTEEYVQFVCTVFYTIMHLVIF